MYDNLDVEGREVWLGRPELKYRECGHVSQHVTGYNIIYAPPKERDHVVLYVLRFRKRQEIKQIPPEKLKNAIK
jgi:hypothetical protein